MKNKLLLFLLLCSAIAFAQIPSYYNDVNLNQSGTALKDDLAAKIISTHTTFLSYTPGVWNALEQADLDLTNSNNVLLLYGYSDTDGEAKTDRSRGKFDHGSGIGLWNREHSYPKSLGVPNLGTSGPGSDAHHLRACDGQMNSTRNNRKYADGSGNATITPQGYFYPGDEWKGDVARMMLFMYLRYGDRCLPSNVGVGNSVAGDSNMVDLFLQWNVDDPVNAFEDQRNDVIAGIQGNRNPFIDNPAFATQIWAGPQAEDRFGTGASDTQAPSVPTSLIASNTTSSATVLSWNAATDNVGVTGYDVYQNGSLITSISGTNYNVSSLAASTTYVFTVRAKDQAGNISGHSNNVSITTSSSGSGSSASELFISEYVEGSSNNKALEIANFTGATVNLSAYTLKKATNGSGSFSSTLSLSGQLANGEVYVVANSSATSAILNIADVTNAGVMSFNGNDAVALFKNNVLIDVLGDENSSANYAQNVTLQRKASIVSPNTNYTVAEWDSFSTDTFSGLGTHSINGGTPQDTTAPSTPSNLTASNVTQTTVNLSWSASTDNVAVSDYSVLEDGAVIATVTATNYSVTGLTASTVYNYAIIANDEAGNVSSTETVSVTTEAVPTSSTTVLSESYFENSWDGWTDGGSDCYRYSGSRSYEGNYSIRLRDNTGARSAMTSSSYNLTSYDAIEVSFIFYAYSMENNEDFWLRYYNGSSWSTVETWARGTDFDNNNFYSATVTLDATDYNFVNNAKFRLQADASSNADQVYIDQVVITGIIGNPAARGMEDDSNIKHIRYFNTDDFNAFEEDFKMYPNPVEGHVLNIQLANDNTENVTYKITNLLGQVVVSETLNSTQLQVGKLKPGVYIIEINDGEEIMKRKFIKK